MIDHRTTFALPMLLALASCGGGSAPENSTSAAPAIVETPVAAPAPAPTGPLLAFVGKQPSEAVDGVSFMARPEVKAAVNATVTDAKVRDFVFGSNGPTSPIALKDGRVLAWGCEAHNCGFHNWSIAILPDGSSADVCFYENPDKPDGKSTWFLASGRSEKRPGNCPSE